MKSNIESLYIYRRELEVVYLNRRKQKMLLFLSDISHITFLFFLFVKKCKICSNHTLHQYYYVYGVLYSRLESKQVSTDSRLAKFADEN